MTGTQPSHSHSIACGDVIPGCSAVFEAASEDELLAQISAHARDDHGLTDLDDATLAEVKAAVRT